MKYWITLDEIFEETSIEKLEEKKHFTLCEVPGMSDWYYQLSISKDNKKNCVFVSLHSAWKRWAPDGSTYITGVPNTPAVIQNKVNMENWEDVRGMVIVCAYNIIDTCVVEAA